MMFILITILAPDPPIFSLNGTSPKVGNYQILIKYQVIFNLSDQIRLE